MNRAVELIDQKAASRGRGKAKVLRDLGEHPESGGAMAIMDGKYGPYVKWEKVNATIPEGTAPDDLTVAQAVELIDAKAATKGKRRKAPAKKKKAS